MAEKMGEYKDKLAEKSGELKDECEAEFEVTCPDPNPYALSNPNPNPCPIPNPKHDSNPILKRNFTFNPITLT